MTLDELEQGYQQSSQSSAEMSLDELEAGFQASQGAQEPEQSATDFLLEVGLVGGGAAALPLVAGTAPVSLPAIGLASLGAGAGSLIYNLVSGESEGSDAQKTANKIADDFVSSAIGGGVGQLAGGALGVGAVKGATGIAGKAVSSGAGKLAAKAALKATEKAGVKFAVPAIIAAVDVMGGGGLGAAAMKAGGAAAGGAFSRKAIEALLRASADPAKKAALNQITSRVAQGTGKLTGAGAAALMADLTAITGFDFSKEFSPKKSKVPSFYKTRY